MTEFPDRRQFLTASGLAAAAAASHSVCAQDGTSRVSTFTYCLNTSTIRKQTEDVVEQIRIASTAGYDGIELWMGHIEKYTDGGGSLRDLRQRISDAGLSVDSAIGFARWISEDAAERRKGLEQARRDMDIIAEIGGTRIAAPPVGAHRNSPKLDPFVMADRYRALLEIGDQAEVTPQLEVWGFSDNLSRLGESVMVCVEASHPRACLLPDVYHIFKGGSDFGGLGLLHDAAIQVFHMNDYPASLPREDMKDSHRVYPGDGVAPLSEIINMVGGHGRQVVFSLELFNQDYWQQDPLQVAKTGLKKMKSAVARAQG